MDPSNDAICLGAEAGLDILELGLALVAVRPRLRRSADRIMVDPSDARRLMQETLRDAWRARQQLTEGADVHDWLVRTLRARALH